MFIFYTINARLPSAVLLKKKNFCIKELFFLTKKIFRLIIQTQLLSIQELNNCISAKRLGCRSRKSIDG